MLATYRLHTTSKSCTHTKSQIEERAIRVSRRYSGDVGQVLKTVTGLTAEYTLNGKELYVRAVINSSNPPAVPSYENQVAQAWTQPVGWK